VLSHGHVDHTGGLRDVLKIGREVKVVAHPDIWIPKYVRRDGDPREHRNDVRSGTPIGGRSPCKSGS
jgi:7,8-dihydropterin-6-yl-methyl-4-(beta-D-ribofuranosyl)aminobenzene 5'-phosphate synthase